MSSPTAVENFIEVHAADLPFYCPPPGNDLWNAHPRVMIPVEKLGEARCPYCSTLYKFAGPLPQGHH
jgi:uncharacterized Zn-finger protein